jgi:hypothetical protein
MFSSSRATEGRTVPHRRSSASLHLVLNCCSANPAARSKRTVVFHSGLAPQRYRNMCVRARANTSMATRSSFRWQTGSLMGRDFPFRTLSGRLLCILAPEQSGEHLTRRSGRWNGGNGEGAQAVSRCGTHGPGLAQTRWTGSDCDYPPGNARDTRAGTDQLTGSGHFRDGGPAF